MMAEIGWLSLFGAALGGGVSVKLLDIAHQEARHFFSRSSRRQDYVEKCINPLLRAADEVVGKIHSVAKEDFRTFYHIESDGTGQYNSDFINLLFLITKFWAALEEIRRENDLGSVHKNPKGQKIQKFINCLESRRVRIIDRISQRAVSEIASESQSNERETVSFITFVRMLENDAEAKRWIGPLYEFLTRLRHTKERQRILVYVAIIHSMIDEIDPKHKVTKSRSSYSNKLSKKSRDALKYRVFRHYLPFISNPEKYIGPPRGRPYAVEWRAGLWPPQGGRHIRWATLISSTLKKIVGRR